MITADINQRNDSFTDKCFVKKNYMFANNI